MKRRIISELINWRPAHTASFDNSVVFSGTYELTHDPLILADGANNGQYHDLTWNTNRKVMSVPLPYLKYSIYEQYLRVQYMFSRNKWYPHVQLSHIALHLLSKSGDQKKKYTFMLIKRFLYNILFYLYRPDLFKTDIFRNFTIGIDGNLPVFINNNSFSRKKKLFNKKKNIQNWQYCLQPGHYSSLTAPNLQPTANL